jgi:A/G-specific adenine glycosylase
MPKRRTLTPKNIREFQGRILEFYASEGRDLPWRKTNDRYAIMVSEIMLQQTQVDRVIPKYAAWLKRFPTVNALAQAPLSDVLAVWSGLGYNSRAKRLHDAAKAIVTTHGGVVPSTEEGLRALPGIGPYTARSVLIFADNADLATVDTNIRRIILHEFDIPESTDDKELFRIAERLLPKGRSREWHNALMDYGATVLTSRKSGIRPKTTQTRFEGSRRQVRGRLLKLLIDKGTLDEKALDTAFTGSTHGWRDVAKELVEEGLIEKEKGRLRLSR